MAKRYFASCKTTPLEHDIEFVFLTLITQSPPRFSNAIDCIANKINRVPSVKVLSAVIFEILMNEACDKRTAVAANDYLHDTLTIHPPSDSSRRSFYKAALTGRTDSGFTNLWSVFEHIVNSSYIHYKIWEVEEGRRPIPHPNCDILIDFYVRALIDNYDYLSSEKAFYEKAEKSLVMDLFWPTESCNLSAAKKFTSQLLQWVDKIYLHSARLSKISAFQSLHKLLNLMIQCIVHFEYSPGETVIADSLICNSLCIFDIVKDIFNTCKEGFNSLENFRRFLHNLSSKAVQFKVCEYTLYELVNSNQPTLRKLSLCTLKNIVTVYMFPNKISTGKRGRPKKHAFNDLSLEDEVEKNETCTPASTSKTHNNGESVLHELCRANKPADLFLKWQRSSSTLDVNEKDHLGQTPLHLACLSISKHCVKILIDECSSENSKHKLNFSAVDEEGQTSLHIVIKEEAKIIETNEDAKDIVKKKVDKKKDAKDIAKSILKYGGSKLLDVKDKYGRKPLQYASREMKQALRELCVDTDTDKSTFSLKTIADLDVPVFQNFKEYAFYCHVLHFLMTYYAHIYDLYRLRKLVNSSVVEVLKHEDKNCPHFKLCGEKAVCSEDFECIKILPDIVHHFVKRMDECAKGKGLNLDLELFSPKVFGAVLY